MKRCIRASETGTYDVKLASKPFSAAEQKRTDAINDKLKNYLFIDGEYGEVYEEEGIDEVEKYEVYNPWKKRDTELTIYKNHLVYATNYDENDRRVKQGKAIPGTIYYDVAEDGDVIDENLIGYATLDDARHAAMIYMKEYLHQEARLHGPID